jgi:lipopolysaccharide export system protein LptA
MKTLVLLPLLVLPALPVAAQQKGDNGRQFTYSCDSLRKDSDTGISTLMGNVKFKDRKFELIKGERMELDEKKQRITVYNVSEFRMDGLVSLPPAQESISYLEYRIGDDRVYLKSK